MKKATLLFGVLLAAGLAHAQQKDAAGFTPTQQAFYNNLLTRDSARRAAVQAYLRTHPGTRESYTNEKGTFHLYEITADGRLVYRGTRSNLQSAKTIKTNRLWTGGGLGLTLNGQNSVISSSASRLGLWEPSPVRTTHQEFGGRAITRDLPVFTTSNGNTEHATHVAGTMIAAGVMPNAKGMSNAATLSCYEAQTDELPEILAAGVGGMLVSNHSYGPDFATAPAAARGYYSSECTDYDSIIRSAPNYLPVVAAGNDRDDASGVTYDILVGTALCKNVVAVAAVNILGAGGYTGPASVVMSDFSSYGPADDGRVKPDISAAGVQIYSSYSGTDTSYGTIDGTSMASPAVAGSLYLLQQYNRATKNQSLQASTLKGLVLHTADEAGAADGPDYSFGWGLLNMERAVNMLRDATGSFLVTEQNLTNGIPYRKRISTPGGPFKATVCWTDPAGIPIPGNPLNDRTASLINDLDLRLIDSATNTPVTGALPWMLDPANPTNPATRGDNTVDNVEKIWVANLPAGTYYLEVTNKGTLAGTTQAFALMADSLTPASNLNLVSVSVAASANPVCVGTSVTFTATPTGATNPTYQWTKNGTNIAGATAAAYTSSTLANGDVIACRMTSGGASFNSNTITLTVKARPAAFNLTANSATTFCNGNSVTLAPNAAANASFPNYQWSNNGGAIPGATSASYVATASGSYTVTVSDNTGCGRTSVARAVTVNSLPVASISGQNPFCVGSSTVLNASPTAAGNIYRWTRGSQPLAVTTPQYNTATVGSYTLKVTDANGCVGISPAFALTSTTPPGVFNLTANSATTLCAGGSVMLSPNPTANFSGFSTYQWSNNGVAIAGATSAMYTATVTGNYTIAVSDNAGCGRTSVARPVTVNTAATAPPATITPLGSTTIGAGGSVTLQANAGTGYTYQWFMDNVAVSGSTGRNITANTGGSYTVRVTSGSCSNLSSAVVVTETGAKESRGVTSGSDGVLEGYFSFSAFPNPADDRVTLRTNGAVSQKATVQVMTLTGAAVKEVEMKEGQTEIDLSGMASGVYLLRYKDAEGRTGIIRLVKQ